VLSILLCLDHFQSYHYLDNKTLDERRKKLVSNDNFREKSLNPKNELYKYLIYELSNFTMLGLPGLEKMHYPNHIKFKAQVDFKSRILFN